MHLRDVTLGDLPVYLRMRCDPVMMAGLGGPQDPAVLPAKVARDVAATERDEEWIRMVVLDDGTTVAGSVVLWRHDEDGQEISEVGWMVLPEHQGQGVARRAMELLIAEAAADGRWGVLHAHPGVANAASNALCRRLGFTLHGRRVAEFAGRPLPVNQWTLG